MSVAAVYLTELYIFTGLLLAFGPTVPRAKIRKLWSAEDVNAFDALVGTTVVVLLMPPAFLVHLVSDR